jgi:hypothetical protein
VIRTGESDGGRGARYGCGVMRSTDIESMASDWAALAEQGSGSRNSARPPPARQRNKGKRLAQWQRGHFLNWSGRRAG